MYNISRFTYSNLVPRSQPGKGRRLKRRQTKSAFCGAGKRQIWIAVICSTHRHQDSRQTLMMTTIYPKKTCPQRISFPMRFPGKTVPAEKATNFSPGFFRFGEDPGLYRKPEKRIIKQWSTGHGTKTGRWSKMLSYRRMYLGIQRGILMLRFKLAIKHRKVASIPNMEQKELMKEVSILRRLIV